MPIVDLQHRLLSDLRRLSLPIDEVEVFLRPFSKTYYGRYFPAYDETQPKIYVYPFEDKRGTLLNYQTILETTIHEFCHHIQYASGHQRVRGVMHDTQFWQLYNHYMKRARTMCLLSA